MRALVVPDVQRGRYVVHVLTAEGVLYPDPAAEGFKWERAVPGGEIPVMLTLTEEEMADLVMDEVRRRSRSCRPMITFEPSLRKCDVKR